MIPVILEKADMDNLKAGKEVLFNITKSQFDGELKFKDGKAIMIQLTVDESVISEDNSCASKS